MAYAKTRSRCCHGWSARRHRQAAQAVADHRVEQAILVADVRIERHRRHADPLGDRAHRDGIQARFVGDRQRGVDDFLSSIDHGYTV